MQEETYEALLRVFHVYMLLVRQQDRDIDWSESQVIQMSKCCIYVMLNKYLPFSLKDLINVLWHTGESATLHILVVHAQIILLTYGKLKYF